MRISKRIKIVGMNYAVKDNWNGVLQKEKRSTPKKRGAPKGNKNAIGNSGGAPAKNQNATKHGLFAKYIPSEMLEIMEILEEKSGVDILWENIKIQYAAIIRAQQMIWIQDDKDDLEKVGSESEGESSSVCKKVVYAHKRQIHFFIFSNSDNVCSSQLD